MISTVVVVVFAIVAAIAIVVAGRGLDGGISNDVVTLVVIACGLVAAPGPSFVIVPLASAALVVVLVLLVKRRATFHALRPRRSTAIFTCGLGFAALLLSIGVDARETKPLGSSHAPRGGYFQDWVGSTFVEGPRREGDRCQIDVRTTGRRTLGLPISTQGAACNGVTFTFFSKAVVVTEDGGATKIYSSSSFEPMRDLPGVPASLQWLGFGGVVLSVIGLITLARRTRRDGRDGPYRGVALDVESVADFGVPPAATAALACIAPLASVVVSKLLDQ